MQVAVTIFPLAGFLIIWELLAAVSKKTAFLVGQPTRIVLILAEEVIHHGLVIELAVTLSCALVGLTLGAGLGFMSGIVVATNRPVDRALSPIINLLAVIPLFAAGPLLVFLAGQGFSSKILLSTLSVSFFAIALTYQHAKLTPTSMIETVTIQSGRELAAIRYVLVPYSALRLITNLRVLFGVAVTGVVVGEFLGASMGIGRFIMVSEGLFDVNRIWAGIALLSAAAICIGIALARLEEFARKRLGKE